jgi:hypothetical protein
MKAQEAFIEWSELEVHLTHLQALLYADKVVDSREFLRQLVDGYKPSAEVVDWVHLAKSSSQS